MKKILLISATLWAASAQAVVINVTTKVDENGENASACSLREAIRAIEDTQAFGGCAAGIGNNDVIQLRADKETDTGPETPYELNSALQLRRGLSIFGAETVKVQQKEDDPEVYNPVNGAKSLRSAPTTTIKMKAGVEQRLFLVVDGELLRLKDVKLSGGKALADNRNGNGGAIWSVAEVALDNVHIQNSNAAGSAGAIFLAGASNPLTLSNSTLLANQAQGAGAIAMTCFSNGVAAAHSVAIDQSSLRNNTSTSGSATVLSCGNSSLTVSNSTISRNSGGLGYRNGSGTSIPAQSAGMVLTHVSIIDNQGCGIDVLDGQACAYEASPDLAQTPDKSNGLNALTITNSVVAFNAQGDCAGVAMTTTTAQRNRTGERCDLTRLPPPDTTNPPATPVVNEQQKAPLNAGQDISAQFEVLGLYGGLTEGFLPKPSSLLANAVSSGCSAGDQRGAPRNPGEVTACDAGAMERKTLLAVKDKGSNNKDGGSARKVVLDVLLNDIGGEDVSGGDVSVLYRPIKVIESIVGGCTLITTGDDKGKLQFTPAQDADTQLGKTSASSAPYICKYKMRDGIIDSQGNKVPNSVDSNEAEVEITVANLAPEAVADSYTRPHDGNAFVFSPLLNDKDADGLNGKLPRDGQSDEARPLVEGLVSCQTGVCLGLVENLAPLTPKQCTNKGPFVKITKQPQLGSVSGVVTARVVSGAQEVPYYGGRLTYTPRNSYSPFTDSFSYVVVDADCQESNEAVVRIAVDVPAEGQGGGAFGLLSLGVLGLLGLRRRPQL